MGWIARKRRTQDPLLAALGLRASDLTPAGLAALRTLADENAGLRAQLKDAMALADRDPGLGTMNRRAFVRELGRTASYIERYQGEAAVLFIDLNGFKRINDAHGHAAGDAVLRHVAKLISHHIRDSDRFGRIGGDEFAVLLNHCSAEEAHRKADYLANVIANNPCEHRGERHLVSASIGAYPFRCNDPHWTPDPELLLARADEAMYADKHAGRLARAANS